MKKIVIGFLALFVVAGFANLSLAQDNQLAKEKANLSFLRNKLAGIENTIKTIKGDLNKAQDANNLEKAASLATQLKKEENRKTTVKAEIDKQQKAIANLEAKLKKEAASKIATPEVVVAVTGASPETRSLEKEKAQLKLLEGKLDKLNNYIEKTLKPKLEKSKNFDNLEKTSALNDLLEKEENRREDLKILISDQQKIINSLETKPQLKAETETAAKQEIITRAAIAKANLSFLEKKLVGVEEYIASLNKKLETAAAAKDQARIDRINKAINTEKQRKDRLALQIAMQKKIVDDLESQFKKQAVIKTAPTQKLLVETGLAGGACIVSVGVNRAIKPGLEGEFSAGYGLGIDYGVVVASAAGVFRNNPRFFWGLSVDMANYSEKVTNIIGKSGVIPQGTNWGIGVFIGKELKNNLSAQIGYSTALGLTLGVGYKL